MPHVDTPAPIPRKARDSYIALNEAALDHRLCLAQCEDVRTGLKVFVVCSIEQENGCTTYVPLARLFNGNPANEVTSPGVTARKLI